MSTIVPSALQAGLKFLRYLKEPYGIIPITIKNGVKRPMVKIKNQPENIFRLGDKEYLNSWDNADYYGLVTSPKYNPNIKKQLFVIDVDVPSEGGHKTDGREHLHLLNIPETFTVTTPSGGIHYYLWAPIGHEFKHAPYPGIDIVYKSPFYFVGVGSEGYNLTVKKDIAIAPDDLLETLKYIGERTVDKKDKRSTILEDILSNGIPSGKRHDTILRLMASLVKRRIPKAEALAIAELAISKCDQSDGLPTLQEASAQYDDAEAKFVVGETLDDLLEDLVFLTENNSVKSITNPVAPSFNANSIGNVFPQLTPNINKPLTQYGNFPLSKLGQVWLDSPSKMTAHKLGYRPCDDYIFERNFVRYFNSYRAPKVAYSGPMDDIVIAKFQQVFKRTFGPIYEDWLKVIKYKYLNPHVKFSWCIYVTSLEEGTGKGLSWRFTEKIFGSQNCMAINTSEFNQRFNIRYSECTFALVDEAHGVITRAARNSMMNALKRIITEDTMTVEGKNKEKDLGIESYFFMYIFSNDRTALEINRGSRRFLVYHDVNPKTEKQIKLMSEVGDLIRFDQDSTHMFMQWILDNVDCTINESFNPKGEARKTDDLLSAESDVYMSPNALKVKDDIDNEHDIFEANIITQSQFEYYSRMHFGMANYNKVIRECFETGLIKKIPSPTIKNPHQIKRYNIENIDYKLANDGLPIQNAYLVGKKSQTAVLIVRDHDKWLKRAQDDDFKTVLDDEISKNGPLKSGSKPIAVD